MPKYKIFLPSFNPPLRRGIREGREGEGRKKKIKKKINQFFPFDLLSNVLSLPSSNPLCYAPAKARSKAAKAAKAALAEGRGAF